MPKQLSEQGLAFIKGQEGFKDHPYLDSVNKPTVGCGHLLKPEEIEKYKGSIITVEEGEEILKADVSQVVSELNNLCIYYDINLEQYQFDMLCSLFFNTGGLEKKPSMLNAFKDKNIKMIGSTITLYCDADHKVLEALQKRRAQEQAIYFNGYSCLTSN